MARDIEEFLRRAAERRRQQQSQPEPPQPATPGPESRPPTAPQRQRPAISQPQEPVVIVDADIVEPRIHAKIKSTIDTSSMSQHAESLGQNVRSAHDQTEQQIFKHLEHKVDVIGSTSAITDEPSPKSASKNDNTAAKELRKLLANPKSVGQAIILAEILKRPDF